LKIRFPPIDGLSLLNHIPENRLRISTGFVVTNDNVPESQVTLSDNSSYFIDFSRKSVSYSVDKSVTPFEKAPQEILDLFELNENDNRQTKISAGL
jgi:hypothetical protein